MEIFPPSDSKTSKIILPDSEIDFTSNGKVRRWNWFHLLKKGGGTGPEKRLSIDLSEIIHLEIYCKSCRNLSILPLVDQPETREGAEKYLASHKCASCLKPFAEVDRFQSAVNKIREGLESHSLVKGEFSIRLVIQQ